MQLRRPLRENIPSGDTDPTYIETNIPWTLRTIGDDRQQGYLLIDYMIRKQGFQRIGIIRASNRYGRFGVREINDAARWLGWPTVIEMAYGLGATDLSTQLERIKAAQADAVVHWGDAQESALILNQMRKMGMTQPYFTSDRSISDDFVKLAGENTEGVVSASPWNPDRKDPKLTEFRAAFRKRFHEEAETYAAHAYDGMSLLIWAIRAAGPDRAEIVDRMKSLSPWKGASGTVRWDPHGRNDRGVIVRE